MQIKFGTDGWRGLIDKDFTLENVKIVSQAAANYIKDNNNHSIVIGYDGRHKADEFAKVCATIMAANDIKVYLADKPLPTPATGWMVIDKQTFGGIMFTASHNPPEFLGFKYMTDKAATAPANVTDTFMANIEKIKGKEDIKILDFDKAVEEKKIEIINPVNSYFKQLSKLVDIEKIKQAELKILFNPMHGSGATYLTNLLTGGKTKVDEINENIDSDFGGKHPEPIVENNIADQIEIMKKGEYNIGIAFDGDADRIGIIDEKGNFVSSLKTFLLLAYYFWQVKGIKKPIVRTKTNTVTVDHLAKKLGREIYEVKVGFKYCAEKMQEVGAIAAGEESGGSGFSTHMPVRDACAFALYLLDLLVTENKPLSQILKDAEELAGGAYEFLRVDIKMPYEGYFELKDKVTKDLTKNPPKVVAGKNVVKTATDDGVKFVFDDDSWLLIRFSGTEPKLRTYAEAKTMEEVNKLLTEAKKIIDENK